MRTLDFSSWQGLLFSLIGLAVITLIGVGIRLLLMQTVQQRRERENRQINERLRTPIAAYKTLGGAVLAAVVEGKAVEAGWAAAWALASGAARTSTTRSIIASTFPDYIGREPRQAIAVNRMVMNPWRA